MALDKRRLRREIERERKRVVKARLVELRGLIAEARAKRKAELVVIRDQCRAERKALALTCSVRRDEARQAARSRVAEQRAAIGDVQKEERVYRDVAALGRKPGVKRAERRAESDDAVRANLPPDLVPVFDTVKRHIKGTQRKSRTEAFLEWAEENPDAVWTLRASSADRDVERLIAEHERLERQQRTRRRAVPF